MDGNSDASILPTRAPTRQKSLLPTASTKSRRDLPPGSVDILKNWLLSPEHFRHPYPTPQDQAELMERTGIDKKQLKNWFTNARRRIWKPMLKKQIEAGQIPASSYPGSVSDPPPNPPVHNSQLDNSGYPVHHVQPMVQGHVGVNAHHINQHYQAFASQGHAGNGGYYNGGVNQHQQQQHHHHQQQQQQQQQYGGGQQQYQQQGLPIQAMQYQQQPTGGYHSYNVYHHPQHPQPPHVNQINGPPQTGNNNTFNFRTSNGTGMVKTDSHAVLMELFTRDQELVRMASDRQEAERALKKAKEDAERVGKEGGR